MTKHVIEKTIPHPLEKLFDIPEGSTSIEKTVHRTELKETEVFDEKDTELDEQLQEIADLALTNFNDQIETNQNVEPKYRARNAEVASQYLNTALAALKEKVHLKHNKEKLIVAKKSADTPNTINNNLIMDRNELLQMIFNKPVADAKILEDSSDDDEGNTDENTAK